MSPLRHLLYTVMCSVFLLDETDETRQNIALQKTAYQSSALRHDGYIWSPDLAVDNKTNYTGNNCRCCASTANERPGSPWWKIDLGEVVSVGKVKVFGINVSVLGNGNAVLYGFKMFVSETTPYSTDVYINIVTSQFYLASQGVTDVLFGDSPMRHIALALHRSPDQNETIFRLIVCEVQVFMPCDDYHFEPDCAPCHCDEAPCNKSSGKCPGGCAPGWKGQRCDQVCPHMSYGENCTMTCGSCYDNITCNHVTGICKSCAAGFHGDMCNSTCTSGTFGSDCKSTCGKCRNNSGCDIFTGNCSDGCAPGYQGDQCLNECNEGFYGPGCTVRCANCMDNAVCNVSTGNCPGDCLAGFKGPRCDEEKICESNTYSVDCVPCGHCLQGDECDVVTGYCPRGCETTHMGDHCAVPKARIHLESVFIGGGVVLVLMALIVGIVLGVRHALRKRRSATVNIAVASDCKDQPVCAEQTNASDQCT